jgi:hypothetical protein
VLCGWLRRGFSCACVLFFPVENIHETEQPPPYHPNQKPQQGITVLLDQTKLAQIERLAVRRGLCAHAGR